MTLEAVPGGIGLLIDANIVVYHAADASPECSRLLERAERGEIRLTMSAVGYAEMLHRLMIAEARSRGLLSGSNPARKLRENPSVVQTLHRYLDVVPLLSGCGIRVIPLSDEILQLSHPLRARYGLLVNDSLLVASALCEGIAAVASADQDLQRVGEIRLYSPGDLSR